MADKIGTDEYLPLMVSAGCIFKSLKKCQKKESLCYLKDRYGKHFAVRNYCTDCYNILYNSSPLALFGMRQFRGNVDFVPISFC